MPSAIALPAAVGFALSTESDKPFALLEQIFGTGIDFERVEVTDEEGNSLTPTKQFNLFVRLATIDDHDLSGCTIGAECSPKFTLNSPWPGDEFVIRGQLSYPSLTSRIQVSRLRVFDRLFDLEAFTEKDRSSEAESLLTAAITADIASAEQDALNSEFPDGRN